ncbi:hypothetical protein [Streptomyces sp. TR02-1]|uniref:hypothetical protein n=1 Tax=Streptomyces sp. TR02-1 TaxID=3385977 RepID=UPI0039A3A71F
MIRNATGALIALVGAAAAVWSTFLPWYGGRDGKDYALSALFSADGITAAQPALFAGLFLPMLAAAVVAVLGVLLRSRAVVGSAALVMVGFTVLWMVRQGLVQGSLTFAGDAGLDWGVGIAFGAAALVLAGAVVMSGRRRGRHRGARDYRLRRPAGPVPAGAGARAGAAAGPRTEAPPPLPVREPRKAASEPAGATGTAAAGTAAPERTGGSDAGATTRPLPTVGATGAAPSPSSPAPAGGTGPAEETSGKNAGETAAAGEAAAEEGTAAAEGGKTTERPAESEPPAEAGTAAAAGEAGTPDEPPPTGTPPDGASAPGTRPPTGAAAGTGGGPARGGKPRAEKGPDALRGEEPHTAAPDAAEKQEREPLPQRLLHRLQLRGSHDPRSGGHRDAA